jgi:hypothetical protein
MEPKANFPFQFWSPWRDWPRYVVYTGSKEPVAETEIREKTQRNVQWIAESRGYIEATFELNKEPFTDWVYFPHISSQLLQSNPDFYANFYDKIQGNQATYYASGLCNFELIEKNLAYAQHLANIYFP